ncbi:MAG: flagellar hook assembly protein FlgD [Gammaproteobacteria bacterium]|nr:flagellar hook assembly protein FlgD [Gammaproteobacteria bacterium]
MTTLGPIDSFENFAPPPEQKARDSLGQEDFLTLMISQFQNQDPFEPMDNGEFLGQLAQFSTVNGIGSLNSSFSGLAASMQDNQALQAAGLVGRSVLAVTDVGSLGLEGPLRGGLELESSAGNVQVDITNRNGELVQQLNLGQQAPGMVRFAWDGVDSSGQRAESGEYRVTARVIRGTNVESAPTVIEADIQSVTLGQFGGGLTLNLAGGQQMPLGQIYQIIG